MFTFQRMYHILLELSNAVDDKTFGPSKYSKADLLVKFTAMYNAPLTLENQPSEAALALVAKLHARRACDFVPLSKVTSAADHRDVNLEPTRIKGTPFLLPQSLALPKRNTVFLPSSGAFVHAVKILMNTYALVSAIDNDVGLRWRTLAAAQSHVAVVGNVLRLNSLAGRGFSDRIADCERNVRTEWMLVSQQQTNASLSDIITGASQNLQLWPMSSEFKPYRDGKRSLRVGGEDGLREVGKRGMVARRRHKSPRATPHVRYKY